MSAFLQKDDSRLKFFMAFQAVFYASHFFMLGNYAAMAGAIIALFRAIIARRSGSIRWVLVFLSASVVSGVFTFKSLQSLLPIMASIIGTWALFRMKGIGMRRLILVGTSLWLINNAISGSIGGIILEGFIVTANATTIIRLELGRRKALLGDTL